MTTMQFRNLDFDPRTPLERWPAEAIATVIDRGSYRTRAASRTRSDATPGTRSARTVETLTAHGEHYGIDTLMISVICHAREDIALTGRARYAAQIRSWRVQSGMTLRQLARAAGTSASRLSDYENAKVAPTTDVLARLQHAAATHTQRHEPASSCPPARRTS